MAQSKNGIEVLECFFNTEIAQARYYNHSTDLDLGRLIYYKCHANFKKDTCEFSIHCKGPALAAIKLPRMEDFTFDIIADLMATAVSKLTTTHRCKKCMAPMNFDDRRAHVNGICRQCIRDYTLYKSKWGTESIEQYRNAVCPITQDKLELGSTFISECCKTGIEWNAFNKYCKKLFESNDDEACKIKCPMCRKPNRLFLKEWSHWFNVYDDDSEYESEEEISTATLTAVGTALVNRLMSDSVPTEQERWY